MELSRRLNMIMDNIDKCTTLADIGTDHGYIASESLEKDICRMVIATDINKGPLEKARKNLSFGGFAERSSLRLGGGFAPINEGEVDVAVIAGMGGNLTRDIIKEDMKKVKKMKSLVLQPAQNPEVLREYLYSKNFEILNEDVCFDEGKYYECFKVRYNRESNMKNRKFEAIDYEVSPLLLEKRSIVFKEYLMDKIEKYRKILSLIKDTTEAADRRKKDLENKILEIQKRVDIYEG